jgi:hypothetical protein
VRVLFRAARHNRGSGLAARKAGTAARPTEISAPMSSPSPAARRRVGKGAASIAGWCATEVRACGAAFLPPRPLGEGGGEGAVSGRAAQQRFGPGGPKGGHGGPPHWNKRAHVISFPGRAEEGKEGSSFHCGLVCDRGSGLAAQLFCPLALWERVGVRELFRAARHNRGSGLRRSFSAPSPFGRGWG